MRVLTVRINYSLFVYACVNTNSKKYYLQVFTPMLILEYVDADNNRIGIPIIYI
jgi:hypothetical protein